MWCGTAAEFELVDCELTEHHLAATIVFNFVSTAYEQLRNPKKCSARRPERERLSDSVGHAPDANCDAPKTSRKRLYFRRYLGASENLAV